MTTDQIIKGIDKVIAGIEADRFTIENLQALKAKIISSSK